MLVYPFGRPLAAPCCWLYLQFRGGRQKGGAPHVPINSQIFEDPFLSEKGVGVPTFVCCFPFLFPRHINSSGRPPRICNNKTASSAPPPFFPSKITFRRLVQALFGTTYPFRPDNATRPPHKIDPCERVAVFLFRVPGGQGVLQTAGHFEVSEESVEDWTSQVAKLVVERLRSQRVRLLINSSGFGEPEVTDGGAVSSSASAARSAILAAGSSDSGGGASSSSTRSGSRPAWKGKGKGTRDTAARGTRGYLDEELAERNSRNLAALSGEQGTAKRKQRPWHPNDMFTAYDAKRNQERNKLLDMLVQKALRDRRVKRRRDLELERQEIALRKAEIERGAKEARHNHLSFRSPSSG
ncbi:unnamed protein product [Ectocarpus sp. 12 AP-2014]